MDELAMVTTNDAMVSECANQFITDDEFTGVELECSRTAIAHRYVLGVGIEIGALHKPLDIDNNRTIVYYVDYKTREENYKRYPELAGDSIVHTDVIDDGFTLKSIETGSQDFVIGNHILEHSPDAIGTLATWLKKLKSSGLLFVAVPIGSKCFDVGRRTTSLRHFIDDHKAFSALDKDTVFLHTSQHIEEFIEISGNNIRLMNNLAPVTDRKRQKLQKKLLNGLKKSMKPAKNYKDLIFAHITKINRVYDIHYHVFTPGSYEILLRWFCENYDAILENVIKNGNGECIGIIRKK